MGAFLSARLVRVHHPCAFWPSCDLHTRIGVNVYICWFTTCSRLPGSRSYAPLRGTKARRATIMSISRCAPADCCLRVWRLVAAGNRTRRFRSPRSAGQIPRPIQFPYVWKLFPANHHTQRPLFVARNARSIAALPLLCLLSTARQTAGGVPRFSGCTW